MVVTLLVCCLVLPLVCLKLDAYAARIADPGYSDALTDRLDKAAGKYLGLEPDIPEEVIDK